MKLLLLFTLSSALCYGQHYIVNETAGTIAVIYDKPAIDTPLADRNPNDISRPKNHPKPKVLSLEEKLLQYAEECYNDSSLSQEMVKVDKYIVQSYTNLAGTFTIDTIQAKVWEPQDKYIHRKPTFEGFIEWLRKQK